MKISKFNGFNFGVCSRGFLDDALFSLIFASAFFLEKHISSQFYVKYKIGYFFGSKLMWSDRLIKYAIIMYILF